MPTRSIPAWAGEPLTPYSCPFRIWIYPRVGGGTCPVATWPSCRCGLSPRGRGNQGIFWWHNGTRALSPRGRGNLVSKLKPTT